MLGFFKYADFLIDTVNGLFYTGLRPLGLGLPVGISFFTFQTMSYSIDLYRRKVPGGEKLSDLSYLCVHVPTTGSRAYCPFFNGESGAAQQKNKAFGG